MMPCQTCLRAITLAVLFSVALNVEASIQTAAVYRLGEDDPGAAAGNLGNLRPPRFAVTPGAPGTCCAAGG